MTDPNKGRDKAVEPSVTITQDEIREFAELLGGIQRFLMSMDFRLRQIEALIYAATENAEAEEGGEDEDESLEGQVGETPPISLLIPIDEGDETPAIDPVGEQLAALEQVLGSEEPGLD